MKYTLQLLPEVEGDAINGYRWYEAKSEGLGNEFLRMFYSSVSEILRNPLLCPKVHRGFRRRLLRRFPYALYFTVEKDRIIVFGLFHCARNPQVVDAMLQSRGE